MEHQVYLGLGSNLGDREENIRKAIETEPWGYESANKFLNGVILVETALTPRQVLKATQKIERELGKRRRHATTRVQSSIYHDRPIDIDILLYDDLTVDEPDLKIPHPQMQQRAFVMKPLEEISD